MPGRSSRSSRRTSAIPRRAMPSMPQTKQQIDDQFKKEHRKAKKAKEETGWHALTVFEGTRDEGTKWRRATEANWSIAIEELHVRQEEAKYLLKRCGRLSLATPEEAEAILAARAGRAGRGPRRRTTEATTDGDAPTEATDHPTGDDPLSRLRIDLIRMEEDLHGPGRPQAPQVLAAPELRLAVPAPRRRRCRRLRTVGRAIGPIGAGIAGGVAAIGAGVGAYLGLASMAKLTRQAPCRPAPEDARGRRAARRAEQGLDQERVRGEAQGVRGEADQPGPRGRGDHGPASSPRPSSAARSSARPPTRNTRPRPSRSASGATRTSRRSTRSTRPLIEAIKKKYAQDKQQLDESLPQDSRRPPSRPTTRPGRT